MGLSQRFQVWSSMLFMCIGFKPMLVQKCCLLYNALGGAEFTVPNLSPSQDGPQLGPAFKMPPSWSEEWLASGLPVQLFAASSSNIYRNSEFCAFLEPSELKFRHHVSLVVFMHLGLGFLIFPPGQH